MTKLNNSLIVCCAMVLFATGPVCYGASTTVVVKYACGHDSMLPGLKYEFTGVKEHLPYDARTGGGIDVTCNDRRIGISGAVTIGCELPADCTHDCRAAYELSCEWKAPGAAAMRALCECKMKR